MRTFLTNKSGIALPLFFLCAASLPCSVFSQSAISAIKSQRKSAIAADYGKLPLSFEANQGQSDPHVKFLSRGNGYSLFLTDSGAVLSLTKGNPAHPKTTSEKPGEKHPPLQDAKTDVVRMQLIGAAKASVVSGTDKLPGAANFFIGNDPAKWHSNVSTFAKVRYTGVYPGVDLVYYGDMPAPDPIMDIELCSLGVLWSSFQAYPSHLATSGLSGRGLYTVTIAPIAPPTVVADHADRGMAPRRANGIKQHHVMAPRCSSG